MVFLAIAACAPSANSQDCDEVYQYVHPIEFEPKIYYAKQVSETLLLDGRMDEDSWEQVEWSHDFVDIEGDLRARPEKKTNFKIRMQPSLKRSCL